MGDYRFGSDSFQQYAQQAYQNNLADALQQNQQYILSQFGHHLLSAPTPPTEPEEFRWLRRRVEEVMI